MNTVPGKIFVALQGDVGVIRLVGDIRVTLCTSIDKTIDNILCADHPYRDVIIDLREAESIDSTSLGLLAKLSIHSKKRYNIRPTIVSTNPSITKLLNGVGFPQIFNILTSLDQDCPGCQEFTASNQLDEAAAKTKVIEAHKILMDLNLENRAAFRELVNTLEASS